jgi:hypothetical protein
LVSFVGAAALASGALAFLGVVAPPASGAATVGALGLPAVTPTGPTTSNDFAGYGTLTSGTGTASTSLTATFTVPALNCAATPTTASWMREEAGLIGGIGVKGATISEAAAALAEECSSGKAVYLAAAGAGSKLAFTSFTPAAGDTIHISATESTAGSTVTITDTTQNKSTTESGNGDLAQAAVWGMQPNQPNGSIPTFTSVPFTGTINGAALTSAAKAWNLQANKTTLQIGTGATTGTPSAWAETFAHN